MSDRFDERSEPRALDEGARRDDRRDLGGAAGGQNIGGAGREIDHRRNAARRHHREGRHRRAIGVRQHDADARAFLRERHQLAAEDRGAHQQFAIGEGAGHRIFERDAAQPMFVGGFDQRFDHGPVGRGRAKHEVGHDLIKRRAGGDAAFLSLQRGIDIELDRLENFDGHLRKPAPAHLRAVEPRERRRFEPLEADRHHHRVGLVGDQPGAVIDLHQAAGDGDAAFRKDDQRVAVLHRVDQRARRHRLGRIERHRAGQLQERLDPPALRDAVIDGEHRFLLENGQRHARRRGS